MDHISHPVDRLVTCPMSLYPHAERWVQITRDRWLRPGYVPGVLCWSGGMQADGDPGITHHPGDHVDVVLTGQPVDIAVVVTVRNRDHARPDRVVELRDPDGRQCWRQEATGAARFPGWMMSRWLRARQRLC